MAMPTPEIVKGESYSLPDPFSSLTTSASSGNLRSLQQDEIVDIRRQKEDARITRSMSMGKINIGQINAALGKPVERKDTVGQTATTSFEKAAIHRPLPPTPEKIKECATTFH